MSPHSCPSSTSPLCSRFMGDQPTGIKDIMSSTPDGVLGTWCLAPSSLCGLGDWGGPERKEASPGHGTGGERSCELRFLLPAGPWPIPRELWEGWVGAGVPLPQGLRESGDGFQLQFDWGEISQDHSPGVHQGAVWTESPGSCLLAWTLP